MKIFGIGTDIVNIKRMEKTLKTNGKAFKKRIFSKDEITYCENKRNPSRFFAKRFEHVHKKAHETVLGSYTKMCIFNIKVIFNGHRSPFSAIACLFNTPKRCFSYSNSSCI